MKYIFIALLIISNLLSSAHASAMSVEKNRPNQHSLKQFIFPRYTCDEIKKDCFNIALDAVESRYSSIDKDRFNIPTAFATSSIKSEYAFIYIHGLWRDSQQLETVSKHLLYNAPSPATHIRLVLPGHGADKSNHKQVTYKHWLQTVRNAIFTSKLLGKKIVLVGQSTGGLLATYMALERPQDISGLILFEPALQLRSGVSQGACIAPLAAPQAYKMFPDLKKRLRPPESLQLGCEVVKLQMNMLKRFYSDDSFLGRIKQVSLKANLLNIFSQIKTPVFLYNNPKDQIVSVSANRLFARTVRGPITYTELSANTAYIKYEYVATLEPNESEAEKNAKQLKVDKLLEKISNNRATKVRTHGNSYDFSDAIDTIKFRDFLKKSLKINLM